MVKFTLGQPEHPIPDWVAELKKARVTYLGFDIGNDIAYRILTPEEVAEEEL